MDLRGAALKELARRELARRDGVSAGEAVGAGEMKWTPFATQGGAVEDVVKRRLTSGAAELASGHGLEAAASKTFAPGAVDEYRQARDARNALAERAKDTNPVAYGAGAALSLAGQSLIPGAGAKTLLGKMGESAAYGAASGLSDSEADLTKGEIGRAAIDTVAGGAVGAGAGALGHGLGKVVDAIAGRAAGGVRQAEADAAQAAWEKAQGALRSARSSVGGEAAAGLNAVAKAEEVVANAAGHYTPAQVAQAQKWLADPAVAALRQNAAQNVLDRGADRLGGSLQSAQNVFQSAQQAATPAAVQQAAEASLENPIRQQIGPRVWTLAHRLFPVLITGAGAAIGGPEGAAIGGGVGGIVALTQGRPGIIIRNAIRSPAVRKMVWEFVESAATSPLLGKFGTMLQRAVTEGGTNAALALHEALLQRSPEYAATLEDAVMKTGGAQ